MRKLTLFLFLLIFTALPAFAEEASAEVLTTLDQKFDSFLKPIAKWMDDFVFKAIPIAGMDVPVVLLLLSVSSLVLTFFFKFINVRAFRTALKTVSGKYTAPDAPGEITHFQALSAALSATVGLGNIAGVAIAISAGGPGAVFWMILVGFLGMTSKFCECTLGVKYRKIDNNGKVSGGAMFYLSQGLAERGKAMGIFGKGLAIFFALMCIGGAIGAGNMFQVNQAHAQFSAVTGLLKDDGWIFGLIVAILVGTVIIGGIRGIARVTAVLVPFMCGTYILAALVVLFMNFGAIPHVFTRIVTEAFNPEALVTGGFIAVFIQGIKRGAFSNEAGVGSAPIAHSAVKTNHPASEGLVALLEPFFDTVVVCSLTAFVILSTGTYDNYAGQALSGNEQGISVTSEAFGSAIPWFPYILMVAVILFAFSTMISWSYYGERAISYLVGENKGVILGYRLLFCACTVIGASASLGSVITASDAMFFAMVVPNLIGLYILLPVVKKETALFMAHVKDVDSNHK
ncbi:alanine:cation symporter family protein [Verrucomicrobiales bacterium]|nr:alanine:cation symporter family protein [Verrucomicrobiales bacterium]MDA7926485.1 alanine:cation symporter family protein [Verrucomicrobiales bacterium]